MVFDATVFVANRHPVEGKLDSDVKNRSWQIRKRTHLT